MVYVYLALYIEIAKGDFSVLLAIMEEKPVAYSARHSGYFFQDSTPPPSFIIPLQGLNTPPINLRWAPAPATTPLFK